jgi:hypothetical protein
MKKLFDFDALYGFSGGTVVYKAESYNTEIFKKTLVNY